ncbi:hypothetical protein ACFV3E_40900 [Streptomyces sp. NPDC059718]
MSVITSAQDRVASLREAYAAEGQPLDGLTDLEVLNLDYELREREARAAHDRYMGLLTGLRKHDDAVRAAERRDALYRAEAFAVQAVASKWGYLTRIFQAVDVLPDRATAERVALLKGIVSDARHMLSLAKDVPTQVYRLDDHAGLVTQARHVVGVLRDRDGISADDVLRLVGEALQPDGNIRDLFDVADTGTRRTSPVTVPPFVTADSRWREYAGVHAFEPEPSGARVVAYALGDEWHLDLYSPIGRLLAYGAAPAEDVAVLAAALVGRAASWSTDTGGYAWRRFADTAADLKAAA